MLWPREAGQYIARHAQDVTVCEGGVQKIAQTIASAIRQGHLDMESFKQNEVLPLDKGLTRDQLGSWIFLVDALNFNFWTPAGVPKYTVSYKGKNHRGYLGMVAAINRAIDEGKPMYDPKYYSKLTLDDGKYIFRSDTQSQIPLLHERISIIREIGEKLITLHGGSFVNILEKAEKSAIKLVDLVTQEFQSFYDVSEYGGQDVAFFKRAQILAADTFMLYRGKDLGDFRDIDNLTMFADYRVPQSLLHFGALSYSENLMHKLKSDHLFKNGDREEVEIRGCSIYAVELIVKEIKKILEQNNLSSHEVNSSKVDYYLWDFRLKNAKMLESVPYHKVRCIYY